MKHIALIGLGLVGSALTERLIAAGYSVAGFDVEPAKLDAFAKLGGIAHSSARNALLSAEYCLLSLPTADISEQVLSDAADVLRGKTVVDTTTGEPAKMMHIAQQLESAGTDYLDATIVGSSQHVRSGDIQMLVGGPSSAFTKVMPLLRELAREVHHLGPAGCGAKMKLVVNLVLGLNRAVLAEGLTFAERVGIEPQAALAILQGGLAYSRIMDKKGPKMVNRDFDPEARLSQHLKDVRLIQHEAAEQNLELPLTRVHGELLRLAEQLGYGQLDNSAVFMALQADGTKAERS